MVPEAENLVASGLKISGSSCIIFNLLQVLPAIQLNNQSGLQTHKVNNIWFYRHLAAKLVSIQTTPS